MKAPARTALTSAGKTPGGRSGRNDRRPSSSSRRVAGPRRTADPPDGQPLLDRFGNPQRYALAEHWYHASMCGRRAARQADGGNGVATALLRELCPWLFKDDKREAAVERRDERSCADVGSDGAELPCTGAPPD